MYQKVGELTTDSKNRILLQSQTHSSTKPITVQPAYMERFGAAKTIPYIQKNHIREVHLYIYILGSIARET